MATIAAPQHPTLSRRIRASTSVILHERPLGWGESGIMSSDIRDIVSVDNDEKESITKHIAGIIIGILNIPFLALAFSLMWGWFIVPIFNLPTLNIAQAYGILLLVSLAKGTASGRNEHASTTLERHLTHSLAIIMPLVVGWIVHFAV